MACTLWKGTVAAALALAGAAGMAVSQEAAPSAPAAESTGEEDALPPRPHDALELPPLRPFTAPKPTVVALEGGARLFLMEDHELPIIDLVITVPGGQLLESRAKAGLAAIWGEVLRSGGSEALDGDALDELLESKGAAVGASVGEDKVTFSVSALREDFPEMLQVLDGLIRTPRFPEEKLSLSKKQHLSGIARRNDDPSGIASREFARALYGDDTPYGWTEETDTIEGIERGDLLAFHEKILGGRPLIGVVGDFESASMQTLVTRVLGWKGGEVVRVEAPTPKDMTAKVYLVDKPEVNQSTIILGHLGIQRRADDPGYFSSVVMNAVLGGGGFSSRLLQRVRTELGLAYSTYSYFNAPYHRRGTFQAVCQTKSETTLEAVRAMIGELERIRTEPVEAEELAIAKESILQQLVFASESRGDVLERSLRYAFNDFPTDYLERFQKGVAAVTVEDVQAAAQRLIHPDRLTIAVVGRASSFDGSLTELGEVVEIDVDAPAFQIERVAREVSDADLERGREIIRLALAARGGLEKLEALTALRLEGQGILKSPQGPVPLSSRITLRFPDKVRIELMSPMFGRIVQCYDGASGWMQGPMGVLDMPPSEAKRLRNEAARDGSQLLRALAAPGARPVFAGEQEVEGRPAYAIDAGDGTTLFIDKESHHLVRRDEKRAEGTVSSFMGDYRLVGGVAIAHSVRTVASGEERVRLTIEKAEVNPELSGEAFTRPAPAAAAPKQGDGGR
jgi:predicted Zn-dependent peptidase